MNIKENLIGVYSANEHLKQQSDVIVKYSPTPIMRGRNVVTVGGGNVGGCRQNRSASWC